MSGTDRRTFGSLKVPFNGGGVVISGGACGRGEIDIGNNGAKSKSRSKGNRGTKSKTSSTWPSKPTRIRDRRVGTI